MEIEERIRVHKAQEQWLVAQLDRNQRQIAALQQECENQVAMINRHRGAIMELEDILEEGKQSGEAEMGQDRSGGDNGDTPGPRDTDRTPGDEVAQEPLPGEE